MIPGNSSDSIYDIMARCALDEGEERELKAYTESLGMEFISTPFSRAAADRLERMGVKAYKIGSGELNNDPLVEHIAEFGKPMIVSTGMNDLKSVAKAVNIMEKYGVPYAMMHMTNLYPTKPQWVRLGGMQEMMKEFPDVPVGLSDHTLNNNACIAALALGADLVERHFTDEMARTGPDIICSMDEEACGELLQAAKEVPLMRGGTKGALPEEQVTIDFAFCHRRNHCTGEKKERCLPKKISGSNGREPVKYLPENMKMCWGKSGGRYCRGYADNKKYGGIDKEKNGL